MDQDLPRACITLALTEDVRGGIEAICVGQHLGAGYSDEQFREALAEAEGLLCSNQIAIDARVMDMAPHLRVVSGFGVGYNNVDVEEATRRGIAVCNTPGVLSAAVADLTIGMMLVASRGIVTSAKRIHRGR